MWVPAEENLTLKSARTRMAAGGWHEASEIRTAHWIEARGWGVGGRGCPVGRAKAARQSGKSSRVSFFHPDDSAAEGQSVLSAG